MKPQQPSHRCILLLMEGGHVLARTIASRFRPDLLSAGIGDGCHAFSVAMPRSLLDGEEHLLELVEQDSGACVTDEPIKWRSQAGTAGVALLGATPRREAQQPFDAAAPSTEADQRLYARTEHGTQSAIGSPRVRASGSVGKSRLAGAPAGVRICFDISDLVYYIGHHPNLTGIQRVQSSIVLAMAKGDYTQQSSLIFLSFNAKSCRWVVIPTGFLISLLEDLCLPEPERMVAFSFDEAKYGLLPGASDFDRAVPLEDGTQSVLCLLGAAWVQRDYFHRVLSLKRRFGTRFVMLIHDLIPIYARETCDQGTARVFEEFLRRALRHVDHYLSVSENTAKDLRRYVSALGLPEPKITVTRNGSSFDEFLPKGNHADATGLQDMPDRFVLFVATVEGRKNHQFMLDVWRRLIAEGGNPPYLVCVGRLGWKAQSFIAELVETNYLHGRIILLQEVSDAQLKLLYSRCLFTVCPSLYEGWGLPVGESLAAGKICVCSDRASLPEVAGEHGVYIDIEDPEQACQIIRGLITDDARRRALEARIRERYRPITWRSVADAVAAACKATASLAWADPYPYPAIPYSSEISFAWLGRDADGRFGDDLLARIVDTRRGYFLRDPLQEQSFLSGEDARAGGIWAEPEQWGTWLCHSGGDLVVGLGPNDSELYYVFLRLRASGPVSDVPIRFSANGEIAWEGRLGPRPRDVVLRARRRAAGEGGAWRLRIRVEADLSDEMRGQIAAIDSRVPAIGFERLVVVPEDDLKARLDVLSNLML